MTELTDQLQARGILTVAQKASIWTRNFTLLCLANLALFISIQMLLPTLPVYLLVIGGNQRDVGYVMGFYTICAMLIRPVTGWLLDSYGRKRFLVLGLVMAVAVTALYMLATDIPFMTVIRGLHGIAFGLVSTAIGTLVVDSLPSDRMGEGMGYFGLTTSLAMALAPILGFWLEDKFGYTTLFLMVSLLALLSFFCSLPVREATAPASAPAGSNTVIWFRLLEKTALPASVVIFFLAAVYGSVISFIALWAAERGITNISLFFTAIALAMIISRPIAGRWTDRGGADMVLLIAHLALFIGMATIGLSNTIMGFLLAGAVVGLGFGFCIPTLQSQAVRYAPVHRRGIATSTFFVAFDLGIGLGMILWGYVAEAYGYQTMYFSTLLPIALSGAIYCRFRASRQHSNNLQPSSPS